MVFKRNNLNQFKKTVQTIFFLFIFLCLKVFHLFKPIFFSLVLQNISKMKMKIYSRLKQVAFLSISFPFVFAWFIFIYCILFILLVKAGLEKKKKSKFYNS